jgi:DNA-binding NtrC family response regulator
MPPKKTQHTIAITREQRAIGLRRSVYRLTIGRGRSKKVRRCVEDAITIGSDERNLLVLPDRTVSRFHARIDLTPGGYLLTDLDSTNGTAIGATRVVTAYLDPGDQLRLGDVTVRFEIENEHTDLAISPTDRFGAILGASPAMRRLFNQLERIAESDSAVLIEGETGSGKELVASELHHHGPRRAGPYRVVDCGSLPESLIEAELFGYERGAFTGAVRSRAGAFEEASGGTLFLDEVGELDPALQVKLLRALEARTVKRLGSNEWRPIDARVIAATHRDLQRLCSQHRFRADLYFRLAVITVRVPPLRERLDDIPLLVSAILSELGESPVVDEPLIARLKNRYWAGNVRELRNLIERAVVLGPSAFADEAEVRPTGAPVGRDSAIEPFKLAKANMLLDFERRYLERLLGHFRGNVTRAARAAEIDPTSLFRLIKRYRIDVSGLRQEP